VEIRPPYLPIRREGLAASNERDEQSASLFFGKPPNIHLAVLKDVAALEESDRGKIRHFSDRNDNPRKGHIPEIEEFSMAHEAHRKAAEHHEHAAKAHHAAADHHEQGNHEEAQKLSHLAHEHSAKAHEHSHAAHEKSSHLVAQ
jgi:hypothetical protein